MKLDFSYYVAIFWRRFPYFAVVVAMLTSAGLGAAFLLPSKYQATATMLVESKQIPDKLALATVQTVVTEQLQIIEQRLLTRANLLDVATRLEVFPNMEEMSATDIVNAMRDATSVTPSFGRDRATFLRVSFEGDNPSLVARVTNEYVTLVLDENVRMTTTLAGGTREFFEDEVEALGAELDAQSAEILKFKNENANALPENRTFLVGRLGTLNSDVSRAEQAIASLRAQKDNAIALFEATGATANTGNTQLSPEELAVQAAQQALADAKSVFSDAHPRVTLLEKRLKQAEDRLAALTNTPVNADTSASDPVSAARSSAKALLDAQLADMDRKIVDNQTILAQAKVEIEQLEGWLAQIPINSVVLEGLQRDYTNVQDQYAQAQSRLATAAAGERIEITGKGQRIIVLEQATTPENPFSPNRPVIAAAGAGAGLFLGLALIVLLELLNRSIRRPVEISDKLGIAPFAVLPYVTTEAEARWKRTVFLLVFLGFLIGVPLLLWTLHSFVTPLDPLVERILNKVGLTLTL